MPHLTEEQIDELLMGSLPPDSAARMREHVAACEACAAQLAGIEAPLHSFKAVSLAWSERRSATLPVRPATRRTTSRWGLGLVWGSVAAVVLLAAAVPVLRHEQNVHVQQANRSPVRIQGTPAATIGPLNAASTTDGSSGTQVPETQVPENIQEIANDNRMLAMVDEELNAPIPAPGSAGRPASQQRGHSQQD